MVVVVDNSKLPEEGCFFRTPAERQARALGQIWEMRLNLPKMKQFSNYAGLAGLMYLSIRDSQELRPKLGKNSEGKSFPLIVALLDAQHL